MDFSHVIDILFFFGSGYGKIRSEFRFLLVFSFHFLSRQSNETSFTMWCARLLLQCPTSTML